MHTNQCQQRTVQQVLPTAPSPPALHNNPTHPPLKTRTPSHQIRDSRVDPGDNEVFMDMMETYFSRPAQQKMEDVRPHLHYQVGSRHQR